MAPIVIYGKAVQDARNVLRSAQISTMFDVLGVELFDENRAGKGSAFATSFSRWLATLPEIDDAAGSTLDKKAAKAANRALKHAKVRMNDFLVDSKIQDVFAIGDVLRALGEYFEFGGGGSDATATDVDKFREGLRNQLAFNRANRARTPVPDFGLSERPELGIFLNNLLDRSTVKYMERFYGPYIGADISGTTTDALDVLAFYLASVSEDLNPASTATLRSNAGSVVRLGDEMVPIATMVLQYHHSLMECGLALSLSSKSMTADPLNPKGAIGSFQFYDLMSLIDDSTVADISKVMDRGNATLATNLASRGLVIIRDHIDIAGSPYADVEIGLLVEDPADDDIFNLSQQYYDFSDKRQELMLLDNIYYQNTNPSLAAMAADSFGGFQIRNNVLNRTVSLNDLLKMNSVDLNELKDVVAVGQVFDNLDTALAAAQPDDEIDLAVSGPGAHGLSMKSASKAVPAAKVPASHNHDVTAMLKNLDPKAVVALQKLLDTV